MKSINPSLQLKSDGVVEKDAMGVETHDHIHDDADKVSPVFFGSYEYGRRALT
jgi:hypothetical protein